MDAPRPCLPCGRAFYHGILPLCVPFGDPKGTEKVPATSDSARLAAHNERRHPAKQARSCASKPHRGFDCFATAQSRPRGLRGCEHGATVERSETGERAMFAPAGRITARAGLRSKVAAIVLAAKRSPLGTPKLWSRSKKAKPCRSAARFLTLFCFSPSGPSGAKLTDVECFRPRRGQCGKREKSVKKNAALLHFLGFFPLTLPFGVPRGESPRGRGPLPRNSGTFFATFFGHKKGRPNGCHQL